MRWEHEAGRALVRRMAEACEVEDDPFTEAEARDFEPDVHVTPACHG